MFRNAEFAVIVIDLAAGSEHGSQVSRPARARHGADLGGIRVFANLDRVSVETARKLRSVVPISII